MTDLAAKLTERRDTYLVRATEDEQEAARLTESAKVWRRLAAEDQYGIDLAEEPECVSDPKPPRAKSGEVEAAVLARVQLGPVTGSAAETLATGLNPHSVKRALGNLVKKGSVERDGEMYRVAAGLVARAVE